MKITLLDGSWEMKVIGENIFRLPETYRKATVPGSVYGNLLADGLIPDPYYRDQELDALKLMENDFSFVKHFELCQEDISQDVLLLKLEGVDTLADIYYNKTWLGKCDNMHRIWEYDITGLAVAGANELEILLHSPTKFIREENEKLYAGGSWDAMAGYPHLRKAHCMFGWDWGPRLPDAGIFRSVSVIGVSNSRLDSVYITQIHEDSRVTLDFDIVVEQMAAAAQTCTRIKVTGPEGEIYQENEAGDGQIVISDPKLWWPNGYGAQPLYQVQVILIDQEGAILDTWQRRIGLRQVTVNTEKDEWGSSFAHEVNGVKIFAMGADYIPEDIILSRLTRERTRKLLQDAVAAHHNSIRVWGGGYYPDDYFYDICDELGLLVWQDFMYACSSYELTDAFEENIIRETADNVKRIRHHACLGLWCGNNEMETQVLDKAWQPSQKQIYDYIKIFEYIIPKVLKEADPNTFYWPSSPSSGGNFDNPWDENRGDTHYWDVWHGNKPFTEYRKFGFRYLSEFGFQSFPGLKTVEAFTEPADRNIFSRVMEMHQRNRAANGKILNYLSATYLYPKDFDHLLYTSQLLQADAIRYGVEHFRRNRGRCMGTVVWQLNDIWPTASWSGIDYYGRWKALHYAEKRMFAPVMISCEETGELTERPFCIEEPKEIEKSVKVHVANETMAAVTGTVIWSLRGPDSSILQEGQEDITVPALSGVWLTKQEFNEYEERKIHFWCEFFIDGKAVSVNSCLFTPPKHYELQDPQLTCRQEGNELIINAQAYAKGVEILGVDGDVRLSDNYFDMEAGECRVEIIEGRAESYRLRSVYDIG